MVQNVIGSSASNYVCAVSYTPHGAISTMPLGDLLQECYGHSADPLQLNSASGILMARRCVRVLPYRRIGWISLNILGHDFK